MKRRTKISSIRKSFIKHFTKNLMNNLFVYNEHNSWLMPDDASLRHEFRVFNGEMLDSKPAITSFYVYFLRHTFLLPVAFRNTCLTVVCHLTLGYGYKCSKMYNRIILFYGTLNILYGCKIDSFENRFNRNYILATVAEMGHTERNYFVDSHLA